MDSKADDLDDGLVYEVDSEPDVEPVAFAESPIEEEDDAELDSGDNLVKKSKLRVDGDNTSKRKRSEEGDENNSSNSKQKLKEKKKLKMEKDMEAKRNVSKLDSTELSYYFSQLLIKNNPDLTQLDYFKKSDFVDASNYKEERTLINFKDFTTKYNKGRAIVLSISRIRIGDIVKALDDKKKVVRVGKGYKSVITKETQFIVGTVERILNLDFDKEEIKVIILDSTYQDSKCHSVLDEPRLTELLKKFSGVKIILY